MGTEILINTTLNNNRIAIVENSVLQEIHIEQSKKPCLVGNIFKGRVLGILPNIQSAFIDIGLKRNAFLHVTELYNGNEIEEPIERVLKKGDEILVQITKEPIANKGARLTTRLSISSRYIVSTLNKPSIKISHLIKDEDECERLRNIVIDCQKNIEETSIENNYNSHDFSKIYLQKQGFIIRTAAQNVSDKKIHNDIKFLMKLWEMVIINIQKTISPNVVYENLGLAIRIIRDIFNSKIDRIYIDSKKTHTEIISFCEKNIPELLANIEYYSKNKSIFNLYSIENDIHNALNKKVKLKSGGYLIIEQTEAMTTIDVNTGSFIGNKEQEETIFRTNMESVLSITRQLKLRNLGGIIIIDFIDMKSLEHQQQILQTLDKQLEKDRVKTSISELTSLGLVQITRERTRESLEQLLCEPCPTCDGRRTIKTIDTVCHEILRKIQEIDSKKFLVVATQAVINMLLYNKSDDITYFEEVLDKKITLQTEPLYTQEKYDIILI